jgi:uncharacterized protein (DUF885 family)
MPTVREIADRYVDRIAALDPVLATAAGIAGHDDEMTDFSPEGTAASAELARSTRLELDAAPVDDERDRIAVAVMRDELATVVDQFDAGERLRDVRVLASPIESIRGVFDQMPAGTDADWATIATRMAKVPGALASFQASLVEGVNRGVVAARRQALACATTASTWGGLESNTPPFFVAFVGGYSGGNAALGQELQVAAQAATDAYGQLAEYLRHDYAPSADEHDGVGADRYLLSAREFNGIDLDLDETYSWGWYELHRIEHAMRSVGARILPHRSLAEVIDFLDHDPARSIDGIQNLRAWLQDLMDRTISELNGTHFDIPPPVQRVEAMITPPGGAAAMYYTPPSEDFSRPGRTWYPEPVGKTRFPLWHEVSTCYHEGVPGHHLQIGQVVYLADVLNRFQRTLVESSGHAEGWALYSERLMGELGYLDDPADELGMLQAQAFRAARVVVDIGLHLGKDIPHGEEFHGGEQWTPDIALGFMTRFGGFEEAFMASEIDRYLGWPGQAISYKVGERIWLEGRDAARTRAGSAFDLKEFHSRALALGPMGLGLLREELARL